MIGLQKPKNHDKSLSYVNLTETDTTIARNLSFLFHFISFLWKSEKKQQHLLNHHLGHNVRPYPWRKDEEKSSMSLDGIL